MSRRIAPATAPTAAEPVALHVAKRFLEICDGSIYQYFLPLEASWFKFDGKEEVVTRHPPVVGRNDNYQHAGVPTRCSPVRAAFPSGDEK